MLRSLFDGDLHSHGLTFQHRAGYPNTDAPVGLVVPGRYYAQHTDQINEAIQRFVSVLMVVTSDEESCFDIGAIEHDSIRFWVQTPREGRDYGDARLFGVGYSPHTARVEPVVKTRDVFLSAQRTNGRPGRHFRVYERRDRFFKVLKRGDWSQLLVERDGFAQGDRGEYVAGMLSARVAPAPTGNVSPDSFRAFEALQCGAIPILDTVSPIDGETTYWQRIFGSHPIPTVTDINDLPRIVDDVLADWNNLSDLVQEWWLSYKRGMAGCLVEDLKALGAL
jgi:hypothetical protein